MLGLHVPDLQQQPDGVGRSPARGSGDFEQAGAEVEDHAAPGTAAPLAEDGQPQRLLIEALRASDVGRMQQDATGEDVHVLRVMQEHERRTCAPAGPWPPIDPLR